jgi:hybrid cluster-associated redox disulfide protein
MRDNHKTGKEGRNAKDSDKPINKEMFIAEAIDAHPEIIPMMMERGIHCIGCGASAFETLEQGFMGHGIPDDEIDRIVEDMNSYIEKNSDRKN